VDATAQAEWPVHPWVAEGKGRVRVGVFGGPSHSDRSAYVDWVQAVEELGFDALWIGDHPFRGPDCWLTLATLAGATKRIRLGTCVACVYHLGPAMLARMAADVDRLSGGRLVLGLGTGHNLHREFDQLGIAFPSARERSLALEEAVRIIRGLWGDGPFSFEGTHFRVREASIRPGPVQQPRVPLLIAGGGERVTLRQVAQHADACNFGPHATTGAAFAVEDVRRKLDALRGHCAQAGRPYDSVLRTHWTGPVFCADSRAAAQAKVDALPDAQRQLHRTALVAGTPDDLGAYFQARVDAGIQYFVTLAGGGNLETLRLLAEQVVPHLVAVPSHQPADPISDR
jgi:alkanesulfonate monooxygenase SsuD/methylene tetrahydromethanopterin reductase-like flavin-dependent oxidoreductase (luciferase family)